MGIFRLKPSISSLKVINIPVENMGDLSVGIVRSVGIVKSALVSVCCSNRVRRTDMVYVCIVITLAVCIVYVSIEYSVCLVYVLINPPSPYCTQVRSSCATPRAPTSEAHPCSPSSLQCANQTCPSPLAWRAWQRRVWWCPSPVRTIAERRTLRP